MFDLITGNTIKGKGFADRFTEDAEFSALYKLFSLSPRDYRIGGAKEMIA